MSKKSNKKTVPVPIGNGKWTMKMDEYDQLVENEEKINKYLNETCSEKLKFRNCDNFPSIEALQEKQVEKELDKYIGYLVYYAECYTPRPEDEDAFGLVKQYINRILRDHLELE